MRRTIKYEVVVILYFFATPKDFHPQMVRDARSHVQGWAGATSYGGWFLSRPILASLLVETNEGNWVARTDVLAAPTKQRLQIWTKIGNNGRKRKTEKAEKMTRRPEGG